VVAVVVATLAVAVVEATQVAMLEVAAADQLI
jgi:hypothetical protein